MTTKEQKKLVEDWRSGEPRSLAGPPDSAVAEALGAEASTKQASEEERQALQQLDRRAGAAAVDPQDLQASDDAVKAELDARGQAGLGGNDPSYVELKNFVESFAPAHPGYAFVAGISYAAGKGSRARTAKKK
jgi:hypothetical protein